MLKSKSLKKEEEEEEGKKKQIRKLLLDKRDGTSADYLKIAAHRISNKILASSEFAKAANVGAYYSTGSEIPTHDLISKMIKCDKKVYLPRVVNNTEMVFSQICDMTELRTSEFFTGIMEPNSQAPTAGQIDVMLVPAVAASYDGCRLGYGRGYYDRYLAKHDTLTIVPLLAKQVTKRLPADRYDIKIDIIVTEEKIIRCK